MKFKKGSVTARLMSLGGIWLLLSSCAGVVQTVRVAPTGASLSLVSNYLTRKSTATVSVTCGYAVSYRFGSDRPELSQTCPDAPFNYTANLSNGENTLSFFFRSLSEGMAGLDVSVKKVDYVAIEDPSPGTGQGFVSGFPSNLGFGSIMTALTNGNFVLGDPRDGPTGALLRGAVYLVSGVTGEIISSMHGDSANDSLGSSNGGSSNYLTALINGNYVIGSPFDDVGGKTDAGSLILLNGQTGAEISRIEGDTASDGVGASVSALANGNFYTLNFLDDVGGVVNAGSFILVNGSTGNILLNLTLPGGVATDSSVVNLPNGNILLMLPREDAGAVTDSGAIYFINTTTGTYARYAGDDASDLYGYVSSLNSKITTFANGNFSIGVANDKIGGVGNSGTLIYADGTTGAIITQFHGSTANELFGQQSPVELSNGNLVILFPSDRVGANLAAGTAFMIDRDTGAVIGTTFAGDNSNDQFGKATALTNGNYVLAARADDVGLANVGSVILVDGTLGTQIGATLNGDAANDQLGVVTALSNGNYVVSSSVDDVGAVTDAGSVRLMNGATGVQIGTPITGATNSDGVGTTIKALPNGNYAILSPLEDVGGVTDSGSVRVVSGSTGLQLGTTLSGNNNTDSWGNNAVTLLSNNNFVLRNSLDDEGATDSGTIVLVSGATGLQLGSTIAGNDASDALGGTGIVELSNGNFIVKSSNDRVGGAANAGSVILVNGATGAEITRTSGDVASDLYGNSVYTLPNGNYIIAAFGDDIGAVVNAGSVILINGNTGVELARTSGNSAGDFYGNPVTTFPNSNYTISVLSDNENSVGATLLMNGSTGAELFHLAANNVFGSSSLVLTRSLTNGHVVVGHPQATYRAYTNAGAVYLLPNDDP